MKKLMLFLVCLVPFVLIFTVQFLSVYIEQTKYVSVEKIVFAENDMDIEKTSSDAVVLNFAASVYPLAATNKKIEYVSSDSRVATVDENGVITFIDFGKVTITAISNESSLIQDACSFFVTDTKVHRIEILDRPEVLILGESYNIKHKIIPNEALDKTVTYSSNDQSVLRVAPTGEITAVGKGTATITLKSVNDVSANFDVEVIVPVSDVKIDASTKYFITGDSEFLLNKVNYQILPDNANNKNVTFISSNNAVAEVVGEKIVFKTKGEVSFTVKTDDGNKTDTFVVNYTGGYFLSASIDDDCKDISVEYENTNEISLKYNLYPLDADTRNVAFESSNENVATVDAVGKVTIRGGGKTIITMTVQTGDEPIIRSANISVSRKATEIVAQNKNISEPTLQVEYSVLPQDNTSSVSFSVSSDIATITQDGFLSFKQQGSVSVAITTSCGLTKTIVVEWIKPDASNIRILGDEQKITVNYLESFGLVFDNSLDMGITTFLGFDSSIIELDDSRQEFLAKKGGTTTIVATYQEKHISIIVEVLRKAEEIVVSSSDITISNDIYTAKKSIQLFGDVKPVDATNKTIVWISSNTDIAGVTDGLVVFNCKGEVTISARVDSITASVTITSTFGYPSSFKVERESCLLSDIGESFQIEILDDFTPADVVKSDLIVSYRSLNPNVATVSESGKVTATGVGSTKIVVTIGEETKEIEVSVQAKTKSIAILHKGKDISIGKIIGSSVQLSCAVAPDYATKKDVTWWISEGDDIASVSASGLVTFTGFGSVIACVKTNDTNITDTVVITRLDEITNIKLFDKNDNLISSSADQNASGATIPTIVVLPDESGTVVVRVELTADGLLDPENVSMDDVVVSAQSVDDGLTITLTRDAQNSNYFSVSRGDITKKSTATIKFAYAGSSVAFKVEYRHLKSLSMTLKNEDDVKYGLEGKRVFATRTYDVSYSTGYTNAFPIEYSRYPENNTDELYWEVEGNGATIDNGVLTIDHDAITEDTEITVKVWADGVLPVQYTYTFIAGNFFNISTQEGLDWILCRDGAGAVLHASLGTDEDNDGGAYSSLNNLNYGIGVDGAFWCPSIYGNGYTMNFDLFEAKAKKNSNKYNINISNVRNATIKGQDFDSEKDYMMIICMHGTAEYTRIQQIKKIWVGPGSGVKRTFKNCIIKHAGQCGLQIGKETEGDVYLENIIFADVAQAAVDYQAGGLYVKGILDVYNFCTPSVFDGLGSTVIKNAYKDSAFAEYVYKPEGKENDKYASSWKANIAIAMIPSNGVGKPDVSDVYFWNGNEYALIGDGTENQTGLGYKRLSYSSWTGTKAYLIAPPIATSPIKHDSELTVEGESKVYSAEKLEAYKANQI